MTDRKEALSELLAKVKAGHGNDPSDYLCLMIVNDSIAARNAYNGSLDAAKPLHDAVLPEWLVDALWQKPEYGPNPRLWSCRLRHLGGIKQCVGDDYYKASPSPARAWLVAILEALIAEEPQAQLNNTEV